MLEEFACALDERPEGVDVGDSRLWIVGAGEHVAEGGRVEAGFLAGEVDAVAFEEIALDILPEVGELEGGAGGVGHAGAILIAIKARVDAGEGEDDASDGIGAPFAVVDEAVPVFVLTDALIVLEGVEEMMEGGWVERMFAGGPSECDEDGMSQLG